MNHNQLISDPSAYVKTRAQRSDDSILLRHMDDVVGTGPEEHLMGEFEHIKTSLYLTDVVVLRHEGDTVNFLGLEITMTRKGFEVTNSTKPRGIPFESVRAAKLETDIILVDVNSHGARVRNSAGWSRLLQLPHSRRKTHLHGTWETRHAIRHPTTIHTSPQFHDREQARGETVDAISQRHATHLSSS